MKLVIGLCGRARHGKDLVAAEMKSQLEARGLRCLLTSFSASVFEEAKARNMVYANDRAGCNKAELQTLVELGHARRKQNVNYWVDLVAARVDQSLVDVALITGLRFENEAAWLHQRYGVLTRITRFNVDGSFYLSPDRDPTDPMEATVDRLPHDYELTAFSGGERWLRWQARGLANYLFAVRCLDGVPRAADGAAVGAAVSDVAWG